MFKSHSIARVFDRLRLLSLVTAHSCHFPAHSQNVYEVCGAMADLRKKLSVGKAIEKRSAATPSKAKKALEKELAEVEVVDSPPKVHRPVIDVDEQEYVVAHPTGDKVRDKVRVLLATSLCPKGENGDASAAKIVANAIEQAMFDKFKGAGTPWKQKYRTLNFNIKDPKNRRLRASLLNHSIAPSQLVEMSNEELANDELRKEREKVQEKLTRDAMPFNKQAASTNMFKCRKCQQRKCTYYQMQTRSADEPLTTFVQCVNCNNRWRF